MPEDKDYNEEVSDFEDEVENEEESTEDEEETQDDEEESEEETEVETSESVEDKPQKPKQTKEENDFFKQKRLREKEEKAIREDERKKVLLETLGGVNPFTNEPIEDEEDIQEYLNMKEIDKNGGDPIADYYKFLKEKKNQAKSNNTPKAFNVDEDARNFISIYPNVNINKLMEDKEFTERYRNFLGKMPLSDLYKDYQEKTQKAIETKKNKVVNNRSQNTVGRASGSTKSTLGIKDINSIDPTSKEFNDLMQKALRGELKG